jgi:hypothetical protein
VPVGAEEKEQVVPGRNPTVGGEGLHVGSGTEAADEFGPGQLRAEEDLCPPYTIRCTAVAAPAQHGQTAPPGHAGPARTDVA